MAFKLLTEDRKDLIRDGMMFAFMAAPFFIAYCLSDDFNKTSGGLPSQTFKNQPAVSIENGTGWISQEPSN